MTMLYVYIAGPYAGDAPHDYTGYVEIDRNILQAKAAFIELANAGIGAFCPHTHSEHFELFAPDVPSTYWHELDQHFIKSCDALLRLPGESKGADREVEIAQTLRMPVLYSLAEALEWYKAATNALD